MHSRWNWIWAENENMVNLKSASFVVIILLHEGLTHIHLQKKSFTLILKINQCLQLIYLSLEMKHTGYNQTVAWARKWFNANIS